jgi:alkylhydroperoxidase family enzyme
MYRRAMADRTSKENSSECGVENDKRRRRMMMDEQRLGLRRVGRQTQESERGHEFLVNEAAWATCRAEAPG